MSRSSTRASGVSTVNDATPSSRTVSLSDLIWRVGMSGTSGSSTITVALS